jgi:hypothetical protein
MLSARNAGPVVHVLDASRGVPVAQTLLDKTRSLGFVEVQRVGTYHMPPCCTSGRAPDRMKCPPCRQPHRLATVNPKLQLDWPRLQDVKEEYAEMREEFLAGLEDRRYLTIAEARAKRLQVRECWCFDDGTPCTCALDYVSC